MKFYKLLRYDRKTGWEALKKYLPFTILFLIFICWSIDSTCSQYEFIKKYTFGDTLLLLFRGIPVYISDGSTPFRIPVLWTLIFAWFFFITLQIVRKDLEGMGQEVMIRSQSRIAWWLSKCVWNLAAALLYFGLIYLIMFINALIMGYSLSFGISEEIREILELDSELLQPMPWKITFELMVLPFLCAVSWSNLQAMLTIVITPVLAYAGSMIYWIASAYFCNGYLLGNYAMIIRNNKIINSGVNTMNGIFYTATLLLISILTGVFLIRKYSVVLDKTGDA